MSSSHCFHRQSDGVPRWFGSSLSKVALMVAVASIAPSLAQASWEGRALQWQYYTQGGPYNNLGSPGTCNVGRKNVCGTFQGYFNIITRSGSIIFDYSVAANSGAWSHTGLSLPPTIHNGIAINLTASGTIKSVEIDPVTNMAGFDKSRLSFTGNQIQVDWENLRFTKNTIVKLDVRLLKGTDARADGRMVNARPFTPMASAAAAPVHVPDASLNPPLR